MDSFEDRIDDDLFELIISYLPIKDKLRYRIGVQTVPEISFQ